MDNTLRKLDLNLLVTLEALLLENNVSRAAERLHRSQPAVSTHLARLREIFGDPLLLPGPRGMVPTARARALHEPLSQALRVLGQVVAAPADFEPARAAVTWRIAATDYSESVIVQPVLGRLRALAPRSRLGVVQMQPARIASRLANGDIDLAFHLVEEIPPGLHHQPLFSERYVLAGRVGHPQLQQKLSLSRFCELEHVIVSPDGGGFLGPTDEALAAMGKTRKVVLSVPNFIGLQQLLEDTEMVAMLPERLLRQGRHRLQQVAPPLQVAGFGMAMIWHERSHRDPASAWLRKMLQQTCALASKKVKGR